MLEHHLFDINGDGEYNRDDDPLYQAVKSYKEAMRPPKQDLDVEFFLKTLNAVNDSSPLKVARNPVAKDGYWKHEVQLRNVRGFDVDDSGSLVVLTRGDHVELSVDKALDKIDRLQRKFLNEALVMLEVSEGKQVEITDVYSHAFMENAWAGLPFDLVLAYFEKEDEEEEKEAE